MTTKHIAYNDLEWGDVNKHEVCGDMGFSFCDQSDTYSEDTEEVRRESERYCFGDGAVESCDVLDDEGQFAIYSVLEADIELDEDDDPLWSGTIIEETKRVIEVLVCATKEQAGWIEEHEWFKGKTIKYRES